MNTNRILVFAVLCLNLVALSGILFLLPVCLILDFMLLKYMKSMSEEQIYDMFFINKIKNHMNNIINDITKE